jgi:hypothetical protein
MFIQFEGKRGIYPKNIRAVITNYQVNGESMWNFHNDETYYINCGGTEVEPSKFMQILSLTYLNLCEEVGSRGLAPKTLIRINCRDIYTRLSRVS